jgi:uncharacterized repeat protein (TIGR01451 family)
VLLLGFGSGAERSSAQAPADCDRLDEFQATGVSQQFLVPAGVTQVTINAFGAEGGDFPGPPAPARTAGLGAGVLGLTIPVTPGEQLQIDVGEAGEDAAGAGTGGIGGFGGGADGGDGTAHEGGGGGGASTVLRAGVPQVISGGGGGATHGGNGGDAGFVGLNGASQENGNPLAFGFGGTQVAGGAGGAPPTGAALPGTAGAAGVGGAGGGNAGDGGGGGGGGFFGGGGGAGGAPANANGAGAGGGSSTAVTGIGAAPTFQTGVRPDDGLVQLSYRVPGCDPVPLAAPTLQISKRVNRAQVDAGGTVRWTITVTNTSTIPAQNARVCDTIHPRTTVVKRGGGALTGNRLCWDLGTLGAGETTDRSFVVRVDRDTPSRRIRNRACVTATDVSEQCARAATRAVGRAAERQSRVTG